MAKSKIETNLLGRRAIVTVGIDMSNPQTVQYGRENKTRGGPGKSWCRFEETGEICAAFVEEGNVILLLNFGNDPKGGLSEVYASHCVIEPGESEANAKDVLRRVHAWMGEQSPEVPSSLLDAISKAIGAAPVTLDALAG